MKTVSGQLVLLKSEQKALHSIREFALKMFDFKRNKKGNLTTEAKRMALAVDVLEGVLKITK